MNDVGAKGEVKSVTMEAKIIRADGTVKDLGVVSSWNAADDEPMTQSARDRLLKLFKGTGV